MFRVNQHPSLKQKSSFGEVANHFDTSKSNKLVPAAYPRRLNFYRVPPTGDVTAEQFELWAIDRLKVLAEIEACLIRNRTFEETRTALAHRLRKFLPLSPNSEAKNVDLESERRKDHIGHFVLRLSFSRSEELRTRFIKAETILFRMRWFDVDHDERQSFLQELDLNMESIPAESLPQVVTKFHHDKVNPPKTFYKVKWTRVPDLIERRRVYLQGGYALLPEKEIPTLVFNEYQNHLKRSLELTARALPRLDDERLVGVLDNLSMGFLAGINTDYNHKSYGDGGITADMVDELAKKHFPMCMQNLHSTLREKKHLRYYGRLQYNLFIKGIGLSVEEALIFWRKGFSSLSDDQFNKEYRYNIRHNYGLEGRRMDYPPKTCQNIISGVAPGPQDAHGCPFRHFSEQALSSALLATYHINPADQRDILKSAKDGHYHLACTRVFELTHSLKKGEGIGGGESVTHPNLYFDKSREYAGEGKDKDTKQEESQDAAMKVDE